MCLNPENSGEPGYLTILTVDSTTRVLASSSGYCGQIFRVSLKSQLLLNSKPVDTQIREVNASKTNQKYRVVGKEKATIPDFVSDLGVRRSRRHIDPQYQRQIRNCTDLPRPFPVTKTQNLAYRMGLPVRPAASADARAVPAGCFAARRLPCRSPYAV